MFRSGSQRGWSWLCPGDDGSDCSPFARPAQFSSTGLEDRGGRDASFVVVGLLPRPAVGPRSRDPSTSWLRKRRAALIAKGGSGHQHDGSPAVVRGTERKNSRGVLRFDFPGGAGEDQLEHVSWDEWFSAFDSNELALLYQVQKSSGEDSTFFKLVNRDNS